MSPLKRIYKMLHMLTLQLLLIGTDAADQVVGDFLIQWSRSAALVISVWDTSAAGHISTSLGHISTLSDTSAAKHIGTS